ncbi:MAG TPA: PspC domain-containing protein [Anaerolineae bacterium]|nr:PspC domain-containing protein [Anaerolineae bacterium]HOR00899.1 PspC domain-containing protein [Anaerolineae bacterium]HPL28627.1 PspC domain-containing protein [Anaerolineae bacterium]
MERRLYRSRRERIVSGVAGGLGEYVGVDPVIIRLLFILVVLATGWGVLLYVIMLLVVPEEPEAMPGVLPAEPRYQRLDAHQRGLLLGGALVALGLLLLAREIGLWWWVELRRLWPVLLIAAGVALLIDRTRNR